MAGKANSMDQTQFLAGQLAALETLTLALFLAHPDGAAVQRSFTNESAKNELLSLRKTPASFREGYLDRVRAISTWMTRARTKGAKRLPQQL